MQDDYILAPKSKGTSGSGLSGRIFKEVLDMSNKAVQKSYSAMREAKGFFSSDFERLLLITTRPDELRPDAVSVERLQAVVETFVRDMDLSLPTNPYRVTLRKLWAKLCEPDWRVSLKALCILHVLLSRGTAEDTIVFKAMMEKMRKERSKRSKSRFFDVSRVLGDRPPLGLLGDESSARQCIQFLRHYANYVLQRSRMFTGNFEELQLAKRGELQSTEDLVMQLYKAKKLLSLGLACRVSPDIESELTFACLEMVVFDLVQLFDLFDTSLSLVLDRKSRMFTRWNKDEARVLLRTFSKFRLEVGESIQKELEDVGSLLALYGFKEVPRTVNTRNNPKFQAEVGIEA
uniref:AP180 N-terminal homology (ANTH) domain-containing protein n=1 Tax=Rhizochromulina marina TaxID=1034831 RepID=A0A7S2SSM7_9STRA|mmetsp:Transcript_6454/g.18920  ORF Transcript_6454/g.18920 Transcript_6454/m.18920 type:complete len:347 (+) Transcript_6454:59-1099(+)